LATNLNQRLAEDPERAAVERFRHIGARDPRRRWAPEIFPRTPGPFIRAGRDGERELVVGQWALLPDFAKTVKLAYPTHNARSEELARKASYRQPWAPGQRCVIPALVSTCLAF